ncbi:CocE/NonD family hydrolase [Mesorhizobium sp.]|uniref:CocE/NonD family hydrolase n=1 Tax=Mesorhizobium sp. TaxID=1871066 RepID=UPI0025BBBF05|nr:CocE/NonD family hydrolase [Mesorhizobium sp.]
MRRHEAISWWRRWLCAEDNKAENTPRLRAYILDGPRPGRRREADPGYWVAMDKWGVRDMLTFSVDASGRLTRDDSSPAERKALLHSPQDTGTAAGEFFPVKPDSEMAGDQRVDDAGSLTFDSVVLAEECVVLGQPLVKLSLSSDTDLANIVVRLVDVHADGSATRVSYGVLNLAHRNCNAEPQPMKPGETVAVELVLDACGYRFAPGHRLRLSLSSAYWPTILPPPCDATLVIDLSALQLQLPLLGGHRRIEVPQPPDPDPLPRYEVLMEGLSARSVERDLQQGVTHYRVHEDTGLSQHPENGLCTRDIRREVWSIAPDDPLSLAAEIRWTCATQRTDWRTESHCTTRLSCTATEWVISERVEAVADGHKVFERDRNAGISRDQM